MPCFRLLLASFSNWSPLAFGDFLKSAFPPSLFFSTYVIDRYFQKSSVRLLEALKDEKWTQGKVSNFIVACQRKNKIFLTQFQIHTNSYSKLNFKSIQLL